VISCHEQVISCHEQVISCQVQVISCHEQVISYHEQVISCHEQVISYHEQVTSCHEQVTSYHEQVTSCHEQVISCHEQVISCHERVISYHERVISYHERVISCQVEVISCQVEVISCQGAGVRYRLVIETLPIIKGIPREGLKRRKRGLLGAVTPSRFELSTYSEYRWSRGSLKSEPYDATERGAQEVPPSCSAAFASAAARAAFFLVLPLRSLARSKPEDKSISGFRTASASISAAISSR